MRTEGWGLRPAKQSGMLESPELFLSLLNLAPFGVKRGWRWEEAENSAQILSGDKRDSRIRSSAEIRVWLKPRQRFRVGGIISKVRGFMDIFFPPHKQRAHDQGRLSTPWWRCRELPPQNQNGKPQYFLRPLKKQSVFFFFLNYSPNIFKSGGQCPLLRKWNAGQGRSRTNHFLISRVGMNRCINQRHCCGEEAADWKSRLMVFKRAQNMCLLAEWGENKGVSQGGKSAPVVSLLEGIKRHQKAKSLWKKKKSHYKVYFPILCG